MKITNFSKSAKLPNLPEHIDGHEVEVFKSEHGILLHAPTHPETATFLLLRGGQPSSVHGPLKRILLDLAHGRARAEATLKLKHDEFAKKVFGIG